MVVTLTCPHCEKNLALASGMNLDADVDIRNKLAQEPVVCGICGGTVPEDAFIFTRHHASLTLTKHFLACSALSGYCVTSDEADRTIRYEEWPSVRPQTPGLYLTKLGDKVMINRWHQSGWAKPIAVNIGVVLYFTPLRPWMLP